MSRQYRRFLAVWALLGVLAAVCGCGPALVAGARLSMPDTITHPAEFQFGARPVVVIPFRDQANGHYRSSDGVDVATAVVGELIRRSAATHIKPDAPARDLFMGENAGQANWAEAGKRTGAELVLTGDIETFRDRDPGHVGILRGTCLVNIVVYDVQQNAVVYSAGGITATVPEYGIGVAASDSSPEKIRRALLSQTALKIVQKFYVWKDKTGPKMQPYE